MRRYPNLLPAIVALLITSCSLPPTGLPANAQPPQPAPPKLVLQITIDQLRGDFPSRYPSQFQAGGFRYFIEQGVGYRNAHYRHANTFTAVGHASLFTGGNSAQHGLAGNDWFNQTSGERVYCVEDSEHRLIGEAAVAHQGVSPKNLTSSTIGDELVLASHQQSRVFSVSIKDRGAILPAGHLGQAYWYNSTTGDFVTSTYYRDAYPSWVNDWNQQRVVDSYKDHSWQTLTDLQHYDCGEQDHRDEERGYKTLNNHFPHPLMGDKSGDYYKVLRFTPFADELTVAFAKRLIREERVGQQGPTDFLAISLSATDYIGHAYGPNSLEAEDNLLRLDNTLADLLAYIDQHIGLDNTLLVLSSDHGVDAIPEYKQRLGFAAGRHQPKAFIKAANQHLKQHFTIESDLVTAFYNPSLYLDLNRLQALNLSTNAVETALANFLGGYPGFAAAYTRHDLLTGNIANDAVSQKVARAFHPQRSGNVLVVQSPNWYLYPKPEQFAAMHGSPYTYDTHVPIYFAGHGLAPQTIYRAVAPEDIAPTLAQYLNINPPSGATGQLLSEVLGETP